jgi:hypothetical protein
MKTLLSTSRNWVLEAVLRTLDVYLDPDCFPSRILDPVTSNKKEGTD